MTLLRACAFVASSAFVFGVNAQRAASSAPALAQPTQVPPEVLAARQAARQAARGSTPQDAAGPQQAGAGGEVLQRLQQITFDRRPSAILQAWAKPEPEPFKEIADEGPNAAAQPGARQATQPSTQPASQPATQPSLHPATDPSTQPATQPSAQAATEPAAHPASQPAATPQVGAQPAKPDPAAAAKAAHEAKERARAARRLAYDLELLQRNVTLGRWDRVGAFLASLPENQRHLCYEQILRNLANPPFLAQGNNNIPANLKENNAFDFADVLGIAAAAPKVPQAAQTPAGALAPRIEEPPVAEHPVEERTAKLALRLATTAAPTVIQPSQSIQPSQPNQPNQPMQPTQPTEPSQPTNPQKAQAALLAPILQRALSCGNALEEWLALLRRETARPAAQQVITSRLAALLLAAIGQDIELAPFLPSLADATRDNDREALNLLSRHALALYQKEQKPAHLEEAWHATQAVLAAGKVSDEDKAEGLRRAVELAPKIKAELGQAWLEESFTARPERGMEVLATIGTFAAQGMQQQAQDAKFRQKSLELQKTAVDALLRVAPERAKAWRATLELLAVSWMAEASYSYTNSSAEGMSPFIQRDPYGNIFYQSYGNRGFQPVTPIDPGDLLPVRPTGAWADILDNSLKPHFATVCAQLYLKVNAEDKAFPFIETLAATHAAKAKALAEEFLRVWTRNHDPNSEHSRTNQYMYMYGFEQRANAIPLTRSKQERNLQDLAAFVARLRALPIGDIDEQLLVAAFTTSHSTAEVYRLEAIESVFGPLANLKPRTVAALVERMRSNLVSVWRRPDVQEQKKTKRSQKDIEREVLAGYKTAQQVVDKALEQHHDHWALLAAQAALEHDENNFRQEVAKSSEFAGRRAKALGEFAAAAERYAAGVADLKVDEYTTQVYDSWFYAALGACDLGAVSDQNALAPAEPARIKAALLALPGEAGERHRSMFANDLFTRMSAVKPQVKYRYLRAGFEIVGDAPQAHEARKVFDYYKDLVTEIRLVTAIDGNAAVGSSKPFGVRVDIVHTREIERESGGFGKYLQNQNNASFAYNYGRPTENYRDKFQEAATLALQEHFEVLSVTFNSSEVRSKASADYGWRVTPYAYLLLKARGPQVDLLPPLRLDLDFLDTSGYAVLPIESAAVPLDASAEPSGPRPCEDLEITQILDERKASEGKLVLEVKATATGLVPDFDALLDLHPDGFEIKKRTDQGLSVSQFADDQEHIRSERNWLVTMAAREGTAPPTRFRFGSAKLDGAKLIHQRYADADLVAAAPEVNLEQRYGERGFPWLWALLGLVVLGLAVTFWARLRARAARALPGGRFRVPEPATPFAVLGLLRDIERNNGLESDMRGELDATIATIERHYFAPTPGDQLDLRGIAEQWVRRAR